MQQQSLMGIAWALVGPGDVVSLGAAGMRDGESQIAFTSDTRFHVGSVTKSLLATGVLRLATTGAVELDAPVLRYLPSLTFDNPWAGQQQVTVRHLLDHTAGLDDARLWQMFSERPGPTMPLAEAFPDPQALLRIRSRPGSRFSYSNMGYTLLGMIIESVTGEHYESYLDRHLLAPLEMYDSTFAFTTQEGDEADPGLAWGHVDDGSRYAASPLFLRPAGQFTTTIGDLARFAQFLMSDGVVGGDVFIDERLMQARGRPSSTEASVSGLIAGYALGLGRRDRHGVVGFCHGGNIVGFVAMLCIFPDENKAFAYSVNTDSETANYGLIDALLIDALSIKRAQPPAGSQLHPDTRDWHGRYVLSPNRFQMFEYLDIVFGGIMISGNDKSISITSIQQAPRQLLPTGNHLFSADDRTTTSHVLLRGDSGEFLISDGFRTYRKVAAVYVYAHWLSIALGIVGLAWLFLSGAWSLYRFRRGWLHRPETPAFLSIVFLLLTLPVFMTQSFMALGDLTPASGLLAVATLMLPAGIMLTIARVAAARGRSVAVVVQGLAAVLVLQWCAVLAVVGMLPFRLWV